MPELCRLEYFDGEQWVVGHAGIALLHPERYVERLAANGKQGRVSILDDRLQPVQVITGPPVGDGTVDPVLARLRKPCPLCGDKHPEPYTGECLL